MGQLLRRRWSLLLPLLAMVALAAALLPGAANAATGTGVISGTVTDGNGPIDGANVEVYDAANYSSSPTSEGVAATTAADGTYNVTGLATGSYLVEVVPNNGTDLTTWNGNTTNAAASTSVSVTTGATTSGVNVKAVTGATVSGTISTGGGPIGSVTVQLYDSSGNYLDGDRATTAANGTYSITGLPPGTYYAEIDPYTYDQTNSVNYTEQWYGAAGGTVSGLNQANATPITVSGGGATVNQTLVGGGELTGTLTDSSGPVQGNINAYDSTGTVQEYGSSVTNGTYTIYGVPAGSYYVEFTGTYKNAAGSGVNDATAWANGSSLAESRNLASAVTVASGPATTVNATLPTAGTIAGTVTGNGNPAYGVAVDIFDSAGNLVSDESGTTQQDGTYTVGGLLPGTYKVEFVPSYSSLGFQFYNNVTTLAAASTVTVTGGQTTGSINGALSTGGQITGTVTAATGGAAIPNATVEALDAAGNELESATTGQNGAYTLYGLPAGSYYLEFVGPTGLATVYQTQYYGGKQVQAGSTPVPVTAGQTTPNINAALGVATTAIAPQIIALAPNLTAALPTITGTAKVGDKLTAKTAGWTSGTSFTYQWFAAGKAIKGATASTFTLAGAEYKKVITVAVVGKASGYNWQAEVSAATKAVAVGALKAVAPKITGTASVGKTLKVTTGTWTKGAKLTYQWFAGGKAIKQATKSSLKLVAGEKGKAITVKVTGKLTGYKTVVKTSKATKKVG